MNCSGLFDINLEIDRSDLLVVDQILDYYEKLH